MSTTNVKLTRLHFAAKPSFVSRYADYLILCAVASVGLIGSLYIFANRSLDVSIGEATIVSALPHASPAVLVPIKATDRFDSLVQIDGDYVVGALLDIKLIPDAAEERYYLDMGNQQRAIFNTQQTFYKYGQPGTYTLELKVLRDKLLTTVAATEITIKDKI
jgi:hypothetical protein